MSRSEAVDRSALMCFLCEQSIDEENDKNGPTFAECDECENNFHPKCFKATAKDLKARKDSQCLRLFCPICIQSKDDRASEKFKELLKWVQKLDLFNQVRIPQMETNNELIKSIASKVDNVEKRITSNGPRGNASNNNNIDRPSYASIAKKTSVKSVVVIKPKKNKTANQRSMPSQRVSIKALSKCAVHVV